MRNLEISTMAPWIVRDSLATTTYYRPPFLGLISGEHPRRSPNMANSIRELWLTRREQRPRYVLCTPSARDRLRMRVCRARPSRALTSVVHSLCECIERPHFRVCGEPVGLEDRVFGNVRDCAECAGARGSAGLHASKILQEFLVTLKSFAF